MELAYLPFSSFEFCTGIILVFLIALFFRLRSFEGRLLAGLSDLAAPFGLAAEQGLFQIYRRVSKALTEVADQPDPLFRELAASRLSLLSDEVEGLAGGAITFSGTETWRAAYQKLLLTLKVKSYFSVAWVRSSDYWNDLPGKQSMQLNYDLIGRGFHIERIHILPDHLWPWDEIQPAAEIRPWLEEQHRRKIVVRLVRESDVISEPELLKDFAIYGDRATAIQELDDHSRTLRYTMSFDRRGIRQALDRWERLSLFAVLWTTALDRQQHAG